MEIQEYFKEIETSKEYKGYFCKIGDVIATVILGSICGLKNVSQINQWANNKKVSEFLKEKFKIESVPCYYWMLCLLKIIKPESLNKCFTRWVSEMVEGKKEYTIAVDGKSVRSGEKATEGISALHIVSAHIAELGITIGQKSVEGKSNEIPAVENLLNELNISGCLIVADAMHCQKKTAETIVNGAGDYLLCVKDNHPSLKNDIEEYVQDTTLIKTMDCASKTEKNRGRIEKRTAYVTKNISWLTNSHEWKNIVCIGAIHTNFTTKQGVSDEWHYYISSRNLSADDLLVAARSEWSVETMHWMLDVIFEEDFCRIDDRTVIKNLNMLQKLALNLLKSFKTKSNSKKPISKIMFDCLLDSDVLWGIFEN